MTQRQTGVIVRFLSSSSRRSWSALLAVSALFAVALIVAATALASRMEQTPFADESHAAMARMMAAMEIEPSGDVDADFIAMMVPHHQGAIDMAQAELRHGHNELLRRIAQEIIVTQQQEIAAMRVALDQPLPPFASPPSQRTSAAPADVPPMSRHPSTR
jgi:hypothetical protein